MWHQEMWHRKGALRQEPVRLPEGGAVLAGLRWRVGFGCRMGRELEESPELWHEGGKAQGLLTGE